MNERPAPCVGRNTDRLIFRPIMISHPDSSISRRLTPSLDAIFKKVPITAKVLTQEQLVAAALGKDISAPSPAPTKQKRGSRGGKAANQGKDYIKQRIIECLEALPRTPNAYSSISSLFEDAYPAIEKTIAAYHAYLESPQNKGPNRITYGQTMRPSGVLKKLRQWVKEDPQFKERLSKLCNVD